MGADEETSEEEYVPKLSEIYDLLMKDALAIAQTLTDSVRHFLYFCCSLIVFCVVFAALGVYFYSMLGNLQAAISSWAMAALVLIYAIVLWRDYSRMRSRFAELFAAKKRVEEELKARK